MGRTLRCAVLAALLAALLASPASARTDLPTYSTVVVVLAPYLSWSDLEDGSAPTIAALAEKSALGCAAVRAGSLDRSPDSLHGAAVLSAGRSLSVAEASKLAPGAPLGAVADVVRGAGGTTAAIGTSAWAPEYTAEPTSAPALLLAADSDGHADTVETGAPLLRADAAAPLGVTTDLEMLDAAYRRSLGTRRPLLVVVDPGDPERARVAAEGGEAWEANRARAVRIADSVVARVMSGLPSDAALVVVSTADYRDGATPGFGPVIVYGAGPGTLISASTQRDAIVTLPDVTVTALALLGFEAPDGTTGAVLEITDSDSASGERLAAMRKLDTGARMFEALRVPGWTGFIATCLLVLAVAFASFFVSPRRGLAAVRSVLAWALVALLTLPPGSLVAGLLGTPSSVRSAWIGLAAGCLLVFGASVVGRRHDAVSTLGRLAFVTAFIILADQLVGGRLAEGTIFSYSPLFGVRFYGLGNEGAAALFGALLVGVGWRVDRYGRDRSRGFLVAGAIAVVIALLPTFGANVGVALWGTAAMVAAFLWASGRRFTWRVALATFGAFVLVLGAAVAIDLITGSTHLGRFVEALVGGGAGAGGILLRKIEISLGIMGTTPVVLVLPVALGAMLYLLLRPATRLGRVLAEHRGLGAAHVGVIVASATALLSEDSSVPIAAILMLYALAALGVVALTGPADEEVV